MNEFTIINYQGSKKKLLEFIHSNLDPYINSNDVILDIFSGTSSVCYSYKNTNKVYANDAETYAFFIAKALLSKQTNKIELERVFSFYEQYKNPSNIYDTWIKNEENYIKQKKLKELVELYETIPTVWKNQKKFFNSCSEFSLFVKYYSTNYFGIKQARDIDALRYSIEQCEDNCKPILFSCLYFAMKESVFSKDGHMAQPLDIFKHEKKLFQVRSKNILELFKFKLEDFCSSNFCETAFNNDAFNYDLDTLLKNNLIPSDTSVIYADPPYTDMQYSRYYHLLNTVTTYNYPDLTLYHGQYTKGLYLENRFQSNLSKKSTCIDSMKNLINYSHINNITLVISFAYPQNKKTQKTDRYVMDIDSLINVCNNVYSHNKVHVLTINYEHSNNRNSESKKVIEYLIICEKEK